MIKDAGAHNEHIKHLFVQSPGQNGLRSMTGVTTKTPLMLGPPIGINQPEEIPLSILAIDPRR